jgi:DNA-binding response OmpR family regulator
MTETVVVADDNGDIRELVVIAAGKAGMTVVANVDDGAAALAAIREHVPDLAILDVAMPELTGPDVCRQVRADPALADVRILLLTASADEAAKLTGMEAGADYFLAKPFSPRELTAWLSVGKQPR